jgi:hypothetical protein
MPYREILCGLAAHGMAEHMKVRPAEIIGNTDRIRCDFFHTVLAGDIPGFTIPPNIESGIRESMVVYFLKRLAKDTVIPKPSMDEHYPHRAVAGCCMPYAVKRHGYHLMIDEPGAPCGLAPSLTSVLTDGCHHVV